MVNEIRFVFVPLWLSRIRTELGLREGDLVDCDKLSGILSTRDILIYKMANSLMADLVQEEFGLNDHCNIVSIVPPPTAVEALSVVDASNERLMFGANGKKDNCKYTYSIYMTSQDTVTIAMVPKHDEEPEVHPALKLVRVLFGRLGLNDFMQTGIARQWINHSELFKLSVD